jgi:cytoskeleton protein RodZ
MEIEENSQPATKESVGQQLRKAREKAGLSSDDIAAVQHLRPSVVQAIELGDYSQIDSELFLKGYVRAYAKQVGLDADAVVADLDQELEPIRQQREREQEANPLVDIERRKHRKRRIAKTLVFLLALGIAGYLAFTLLLPDLLLPGQEAGSSGVVTQPESVLEDKGGTEAPAASTEPERSGTEVITSADESLSEVTGSGPMATEQSGLAEPVTDQIPAVVQNPEPVLENPGGLSEVADTGRLQIRFSNDCWVQVSDAEGNRLVNSLQRNGDKIDVAGSTPLRVVIGAVDAVESIRFQGEPVDISGYQVVNNRSEFILTI